MNAIAPGVEDALIALAGSLGATSIHITPVRVCDHCGDSEKEAFPYGAVDRNGNTWQDLCNDCWEALGCGERQPEVDTDLVENLNFAEECLARPERLGYLQWHEKAERLNNRGIRQSYCKHCLRWRFPNIYMPFDRCQHFEMADVQPRAK